MLIITVFAIGHPSSRSRALTSSSRTSKQKENKGLFKDNDRLNIPLPSLRVLSWCESFLHCFKNRCWCGVAHSASNRISILEKCRYIILLLMSRSLYSGV